MSLTHRASSKGGVCKYLSGITQNSLDSTVGPRSDPRVTGAEREPGQKQQLETMVWNFLELTINGKSRTQEALQTLIIPTSLKTPHRKDLQQA